MTVPADLKGAKGDMHAARVLAPINAVMIYGLYEFITLGVSLDHYLHTYIPLLGGVVAFAGFFTYYLVASMPRKISWKNLLQLLGLLPYCFALYVVGFLGLYTIYRGLVEVFSIWLIIAGLFWATVGYVILNRFYLITEIVRRHDELFKDVP
jgi:hypothetical protein